MSTMFIQIEGIKLKYKILGEGKPVIILHGWLDKSESLNLLGMALSKKFKVYLIDLPGFGMSEDPKSVWGREEYVNFIRVFLNEMKVVRPVIIGHSFGGSVAIKYAYKFPKYTKSLVLIASSGIHLRTFKRKLMYKFENSKVMRFSVIRNLYPKAKRIIHNFYDDPLNPKTSVVMRKIREKIILEDLTELLPKLKIDTLIIWGSKDEQTPVKLAEVLHQSIANSKLFILENYAHSLPFVAPEVIANIIIKNFYKWPD